MQETIPQQLLAHLDSLRLLFLGHAPGGTAQRVYDQYAGATLQGLGLSRELAEIYSAQKKTELLTYRIVTTSSSIMR
jgi:hypothetical protein